MDEISNIMDGVNNNKKVSRDNVVYIQKLSYEEAEEECGVRGDNHDDDVCSSISSSEWTLKSDDSLKSDGSLKLDDTSNPDNKLQKNKVSPLYDTDDHKYYSSPKESDTINVMIPAKYRTKKYIISMSGKGNYLINFYNNLQVIRKQKVSFRDITLNHILLYKIREKEEDTCIKLYLNLGLNPFLYINDYYVSELNSWSMYAPILVFKRYKIFDPYSDMILKVVNKTKMIVRNDDIFSSDVLYSLKSLNVDDNVYTNDITITNYTEDLTEHFLWKCQQYPPDPYVSKQSNILNSLKKFIDTQKVLNNNSPPENLSQMLYIWKYGTTEYSIDKKEFEWININGSTDYDLVREYNSITMCDFNNILKKDKTNLTKQELRGINRLELLGYDKFINKMIDTMHAICNTSLCIDNKKIKVGEIKDFEMSPLRIIINNYILNAQKYINEGDYTGISKYVKADLFSGFFESDNLYVNLLNNGLLDLLEEGLDEYSKEVVNNEDYELQTPDIYILLGFNIFPCFFSKELWETEEFQNNKRWIYAIKSLNFLESTGWYYIYGLCCFFAQVVGPSYYIYNYYLIDENEYCPNNSFVLNKFFAVAYYLILYARMNSFWRSLTTTVWQYGNTTVITNDNYLRLTLIVNTLCLYIVPLFTYTLFIELSNVTDLILNCLTGEFLINIDNLIVEFIGEESYIKTLTKDLLIFSFLEKGFPKKNIMDGDTNELWLMTVFQVLQMFITLSMTFVVYKCI